MKMTIRTALSTLMIAATATLAHAGDPTGTWTRPSTGTVVKFYNCGDNLCAKIIGVKDKTLEIVGIQDTAGHSKNTICQRIRGNCQNMSSEG